MQSLRNRWVVLLAPSIALAITTAGADLMPGDCPPEDLHVTLNTGWDEDAEAPIASGSPDDDWNVLATPPGPFPVTPYDAGVRDAPAAWLTMPDSKWIAASAPGGPNGTYIYEHCWCMDDSFSNPLLTFAIRADDQADVLLNGSIILTLPEGTYNDPLAIGMSVNDPTKFLVGLNCMVVRVKQLYGGPHGFNLTGSVTADDGRCCGCYELPPDAEAWWPLGEPTGPTAADVVDGHDGTHAHFILSGSPPTPTLFGYVNGALIFDGIEDYVDVPDSPGLDFDTGDDFTIDAWIQTTSSLRAPIVHKKDLAFNAPGYAFMVGGGVLTFEMADGANTITCNGGSGLNDGLWHFVAVTVERSDPFGVRLYVNGLPAASCSPSPMGNLSNALPLSIGAKPTAALGAMWWKGPLDEIEIFRRALTPTQILQLKQAGEAGKCPPDLPTPCSESEYPQCGGTCPPGEQCVQGPNTNCACEPLPPCGTPGDYPTCGGPCPPGLVCRALPTQVCECEPEVPECGDTVYPSCNGACPQGQNCVNQLGTDACHCEPAPQACGDPLYPACGGACPVNQKCVARNTPFPGCECQTCDTLGGSGLGGITVAWPATKDQLRWAGASECAVIYNTYRFTGARLPDANRDGLADDYGSCYVGEIIGFDVPDGSTPPSGQVHWYLVTGEDFQVEGSLGENSAGIERPNQAPCP